MENREIEYLGCPFCGGEAQTFNRNSYSVVECRYCEFSVKVPREHKTLHPAKLAAAFWNMRQPAMETDHILQAQKEDWIRVRNRAETMLKRLGHPDE